MSSASPPPSENDLDFGPTLRGLRAGQSLFGQRYQLKRQLGRGGMGVVWLAQDGRLEREVALKFVPETVRGDAVAIDELKRETRRCLELTHPNIVRIYDFEQEDEWAAIAMEFVNGKTLSELRLEKSTRVFEVDEVLPWLQAAAMALHHAHAQAQIVHRDLKPSNLMLTQDGYLKVADFGIASRIGDSMSRLSRKVTSSVAGTLVYMSPQQMMGLPPSVADDIYSLGATVYELLTGKPPFHTGSIERQIESVMPPAMAERRKELQVNGGATIPEEWEKMVAACLDKDASRRPQSVRDVLGMLGCFFSGELGAPLPPGARGIKRKTVAMIVLTVVLSAAMAWAIYNERVVIPRQQELQRQAELTLEAQQAAEKRADQLKAEKAEEVRQAEAKRLEAERQKLLAEQQAKEREARLKQEIAQQNMAQNTVQADYESLKQKMQQMEAQRPAAPPAVTETPLPQAIESRRFWVIACQAEESRADAESHAKKWRSRGLPAEVIWVPDYPSLSGVNLWLVCIGPYDYPDGKGLAKQVLHDQVLPYYKDAYGVKLDQSKKRETFRD
jgi:hypothetical protein